MRDRVLAVLQGQMPDQLPFGERLETWYASHRQVDTLPAGFEGMSLNQVHRCLGMGRPQFVAPYALRAFLRHATPGPRTGI